LAGVFLSAVSFGAVGTTDVGATGWGSTTFSFLAGVFLAGVFFGAGTASGLGATGYGADIADYSLVAAAALVVASLLSADFEAGLFFPDNLVSAGAVTFLVLAAIAAAASASAFLAL